MPIAVRDAFLQARRERRPVVIGVPFDLQDRPWEGPAESAQAFARVAAAPFADSAASRRRGQRRASWSPAPSGWSCSRAWARSKRGRAPACRALAAKTGGLLATTLPARGLFHDDPFCIGISGSFTPEVGLEYLKAGRLRRRGRLLARLPRRRRRPALAEGEDAADRHRSASRSARARRWRVITCAPTRDWASRH